MNGLGLELRFPAPVIAAAAAAAISSTTLLLSLSLQQRKVYFLHCRTTPRMLEIY